MAERQVNISFAVKNKDNKNKALTDTLNILKQIRVEIDALKASGVDLNTAEIKKDNKEIKDLDNSIKKLNTTVTNTNKQLKNVNTTFNNTAKSAKTAKTEIAGVVGSLAMLNVLKKVLPEFLKFEDAVYNLGVVSGLSVNEIESLKSQMLSLGAQFPQTATEITQGVDTIKRTGETLADSMLVVQSASKLATASGEDLASTIQIVNKILVAMDISAEDSAKSMATLHSVAVNTATDLKKTGQASKYWSSALATFGNMSTKAGDDLSRYKQELFDFGAIASGTFANLGRDSTMAGTGIRTLVSKIAMMEKTAKMMFEKDVLEDAIKVDPKTFKVTTDGIKLTSDLLSKMAMEDLPKTVNLLSDLFTKGIIELPTIQKMFTTRQGLAIASFLQTVNGDWGTYSERIKNASNLTDDYNKQLNNLNNQLGILKGNIRNSLAPIGEDVKNVMGSTITMLNEAISKTGELGTVAKIMTPAITGLFAGLTATTAIASFSKLISTITGGMKLIQVLPALMTNPITIGVGALVTTVAMYKKIETHFENIIAEQEKNVELHVKSLEKINETNKILNVSESIIKKIINSEIKNPWDDLKISLDSYKESLKKLSDIQEGLEQGKEGMDTDSFIERYRNMQEEIEKSKMYFSRSYFDTRQNELGKIYKEISNLENFIDNKRKENEKKADQGTFSWEVDEEPIIATERALAKLKNRRDELVTSVTSYNNALDGIKTKEKEASEMALEYLDKLQQNIESAKETAQKSLTGAVKTLISKSDFDSVEDLLNTVNKYDKEFGKSISGFIPKGLTKEQSKALANSQELLTYTSAMASMQENIDDLTKSTSDKQRELNYIFKNQLETNGELTKDEELAVQSLQKKIQLNNVNKKVLKDMMEIYGLTLEDIKNSVKESEKVSLPYIKLNNELAKAKKNLAEYGLSGESLFDAQKKSIKEYYEELKSEQIDRILQLDPQFDYKEMSDIKSEIDRLMDMEPTKDNNEKIADLKTLYNEWDKLNSLVYKEALENEKNLEEYRKFKLDKDLTAIDNQSTINGLLRVNTSIQKDSEIVKLRELKAERESLKLKLNELDELKDSVEYENTKNKIKEKGLEIDNQKYYIEYTIKELQKQSNQEIQNRNMLSENYYKSSTMHSLEVLQNTKKSLEWEIALAGARGNLVTKKEKELELEKTITEEKKTQMKLAQEQASWAVSTITSISKGQALQTDFSGSMTTALSAMTDKDPNTGFSSLELGDQIGAIAGSMQLLDNIMDEAVTAELKSLQYEQSVLDLRIQGAQSEEEKLALEKEQLELQKQAIDLQYQAQTSYMGVSGVTGSALSSGVSGAVSGAMIGGISGALVGGALGIIGGIASGNKAKIEAENQKAQLENQYNMTKYLQTIADNTKTSNEYMKTLTSASTSIGVRLASQKAMTGLVQGADLSGAGTSEWEERYYERKWYGKKSLRHRTKVSSADVDLADIGMSYGDLLTGDGMSTAISSTEQKITSLKNSLSGLSGEAKATTEATIQAYENMLENLQNVENAVESLKPQMFSSYFGASLETYEDDAGVTQYASDWTSTLASVFTMSYENAMNNISGDVNSVTKQFFDGLNNLFINNFSGMSDVAEEIKEVFKDLSEYIADKGMDDAKIEQSTKKLIELTEEYKKEQENVNQISSEFVSTWLDNGGKISDVYDSMTESMKGVYDATVTALDSDSYGDMASNFGSNIGKMVTESWKEQLIDAKYSQEFETLNQSILDAISTQSTSSISSLVGQSNQLLAQLETDRRELDAISSLFDFNANVQNLTENQAIEYTTGTTKDTVINNYISTELNADTLITNDETLERFFVDNANFIQNALERVKG